jgi:hypothetical protein
MELPSTMALTTWAVLTAMKPGIVRGEKPEARSQKPEAGE